MTQSVTVAKANGLVTNNVFPYMGVQFDRTITLHDEDTNQNRLFRIITYQAYNAFGLIGSECNGVAVLDENGQQVLCDQIEQQSTGWFGANEKQIAQATKLCEMDWPTFREFINNHPRTRYRI